MALLSIHHLAYVPTVVDHFNESGFSLSIKDFEIQVGESVAIVGPSGTGKTTLLDLITGVRTPDAGCIRFRDNELTSLSPYQFDRVRGDDMGLLFQTLQLLPFANARTNVEAAGAFSRAKREKVTSSGAKSADQLLEALGIQSSDISGRPVSALSVGQQQRVAAARALYGSPDLILADEPTSALDASNRDKFLDHLWATMNWQSQALVMVTHDQEITPRFDRVINMNELNQERKA